MRGPRQSEAFAGQAKRRCGIWERFRFLRKPSWRFSSAAANNLQQKNRYSSLLYLFFVVSMSELDTPKVADLRVKADRVTGKSEGELPSGIDLPVDVGMPLGAKSVLLHRRVDLLG